MGWTVMIFLGAGVPKTNLIRRFNERGGELTPVYVPAPRERLDVSLQRAAQQCVENKYERFSLRCKEYLAKSGNERQTHFVAELVSQ